eukprot:TRINITY_DN50569_c0_g1_i1.p1 TRINITY_DN50569_c0_g1~~TRINITY_DN50569_c0_g1_i1.p1  ORF type:complete len:396 (-),score=60.24 TRINITY_DN50569_c0_g1_i1:450-1610(-)
MAVAPPQPLPLSRSVSAGGIPVFSGADVSVLNRPEKNFDGLDPREDRVWFGKITFEVAGEQWQLEKFINFGAEGQTYLASRESDGQTFAAKFVSKADSSEVKLVSELPRQLVIHPNFIKYELIVLDVKDKFSPAHAIIFMEHVPNGEVFDLLASSEPSVAGKPVSEGTSRRFIHDLISGMAECYRFGLTHRDLKPENLLINENGRIIIIDMGHAKRAEATNAGPGTPLTLERTTTANPYGTPAFNAPEVSSGKTYDCEKADVWSVGVIAFYLHGKLPAFSSGGGVGSWHDVGGPDNFTLWSKIAGSGYYPQFPDHLKEFINCMWRMEPAERPSFGELEKAVQNEAETLAKFPGLQWLAMPTNDTDAFISELSRSCPGKSFISVKRW